MPKIVYDESDPIGDFLSAARAASQADLRNRLAQGAVDYQTYRDGQFAKNQNAVMDRQLAVEDQRTANAIARNRENSIWQRLQRQHVAKQQADALTNHFTKTGTLTPEIADAIAYINATGDIQGVRDVFDPEVKAKRARQQEQEAADIDARAALLELLGAPKDQVDRVKKSGTAFDNYERAFREQKAAKSKGEQLSAAMGREDQYAQDRTVNLADRFIRGEVDPALVQPTIDSLDRQRFERTQLLGQGQSPGQYEPLPSDRVVAPEKDNTNQTRLLYNATLSEMRDEIKQALAQAGLREEDPDAAPIIDEVMSRYEEPLSQLRKQAYASVGAPAPAARPARFTPGAVIQPGAEEPPEVAGLRAQGIKLVIADERGRPVGVPPEITVKAADGGRRTKQEALEWIKDYLKKNPSAGVRPQGQQARQQPAPDR